MCKGQAQRKNSYARHFYPLEMSNIVDTRQLSAFDSQRNQLNLQLGYLEMKKRLGYYYGNWYTFHSVKPARTYWRGFLSYLTKEIQLELSFSKA